MKVVALMVMCLLSSVSSVAAEPIAPETRAELFQNGIEAYRAGDFAKAQNDFERILEDGFRNGKIYYNLGNIFYRQGDVGAALANYLKAKQLTPRDRDLNSNLEFLRSQTKDRIDPSTSTVIQRTTLFWTEWFSPAEWFWIFAVLHGLFWTGACIWLFRRSDGLGYALLGNAFLVILAAFALGFRLFFADPVAVISEPQVTALSGPGSAYIDLFVLHEGTEVTVTDAQANWIRIRLADGKEGWVQEKDLIQVRRG